MMNNPFKHKVLDQTDTPLMKSNETESPYQNWKLTLISFVTISILSPKQWINYNVTYSTHIHICKNRFTRSKWPSRVMDLNVFFRVFLGFYWSYFFPRVEMGKYSHLIAGKCIFNDALGYTCFMYSLSYLKV